MEKEPGKNKFNCSCFFSTWVVVKLALLLTKSRNGSWTDDREAASESIPCSVQDLSGFIVITHRRLFGSVSASGPCPILIPKGNVKTSGWRLWGYETSSTQCKIWASSVKKLIIAVLCSSGLEMFQLNWIFTGERSPMCSCLEQVSLWRTSQIQGAYSQASECQCVPGKWSNLLGWWRQFCIISV